MDLLREEFGCIVGYSDHTAGYHIPLAAVAREAKILEKHITLEFDIPDAQDWKVSCGPQNLSSFVAEVRAIEAALGSRDKRLSANETQNVAWARKSLVTVKNLSASTVIEASMFTAKRPGTGISPHEIEQLVGRQLAVDLEADTVVRWDMVK
jgi:N-acetylneuraminate synthase/N,N'-diacetyllegionaminate synthase